MSEETAAAILTEIYFRHVPAAGTKLVGAPSKEDISFDAADTIGKLYGYFLGKLTLYKEWGVRGGS